jgi:LysM repeat protein
MRKEVKLGMALGGGLVALLIAYLIVAPPSDHRRGTQLVTADGQQSIIDPSSQSGGDAAPAAPVTDEKAALTNDPARLDTPTPRPHPEQSKAGDATAASDKPVGPAHNSWEMLENGAPNLKGATPVIPVSAAPPAEKPKAAPKPAEKTTPKRVKDDARLVQNVTHEPGRRAEMYISDPNAAWGDGLSTRSATEAMAGTERPAAKTAPKAERSVPAAADEEPGTLGSTSAVPTAGSTHVVRSGETFSSIAQTVYGSAAYYPHLIRANPHANPNNLKLGTAITIPKLEDVKATGNGERSTAAAMKLADDVKLDPTKQYRVAPGDSLYKISIKVYGKSTYIEALHEKNKQLIGPNATKLKPGMILDLPEKAGVAAPGQQAASAAGDGASGGVAEQH